MKIKLQRDSQWSRYSTRFGEVAISRTKPHTCAFIPSHTPCISIKLTRSEVVQCLNVWRNRIEPIEEDIL